MKFQRSLQTFQSGDFTLVASVELPPSAGEQTHVPAVLFCHGFTGSRIEARRVYARQAQMLAARGIACFRFDHRGCGDSDGDFLDFTPQGMLQDLDAAAAAFLQQPWLDHSRMGVLGYSLGGISGSYLLGHHPEFRTGVLWAPVSRPEIIRDRLSNIEGWADRHERGYLDHYGHRVNTRYIDTVGQELRPLEWAAKFPGPVLFIHGVDDEVVRPEQSERFLSVRNNAADERIVIPGADHGFIPAHNIDRLQKLTGDWFARFLLDSAD